MSHSELALSPGINIFSTLAVIEAELHRNGSLQPWQYTKDQHFVQSVLPFDIKSLADVTALLQQLDADNKNVDPHPRGCVKARSLRHSLDYAHLPVISPLDWARSSIARARRVHCGCHETGSFAKVPRREYLFS